MIVFYIILAALFVWILGLTFVVIRQHVFFGRLTAIKHDNLNGILRAILKREDAGKKEFNELFAEIARIDREKQAHIQKVGFIKYRSFGEDSFENSFTFALLDKKGDGVVVTAMQLSGATKVYAKEVQRGKGKVLLSNEERHAVAKAMKI